MFFGVWRAGRIARATDARATWKIVKRDETVRGVGGGRRYGLFSEFVACGIDETCLGG